MTKTSARPPPTACPHGTAHDGTPYWMRVAIIIRMTG
jgi:hypothetical protein